MVRPPSSKRDRTLPSPSANRVRARGVVTGKLDDGLTQALVKIHRDRHGQVDGVSFDFRHTDLDPDEWWMDAYSGLANEFRMRPSFWPFLWFPWFGEFSPAQVDESIDRELSEHPSPERSEPDQRAALRHGYTPDAFVERGDAVTLAEVKIARAGHGSTINIVARFGWALSRFRSETDQNNSWKSQLNLLESTVCPEEENSDASRRLGAVSPIILELGQYLITRLLKRFSRSTNLLKLNRLPTAH
jgi:hypothetical protein